MFTELLDYFAFTTPIDLREILEKEEQTKMVTEMLTCEAASQLIPTLCPPGSNNKLNIHIHADKDKLEKML